MVIRFFKDNNISSLIALPVLTVVVYALGFFKNPPIISVDDAGPVYSWIMNYLKTYSRIFHFLLGLVLLIAQVFYLNHIVNKYEVLYKPSHLPSLMYIVCMSLFPSFLCLHPMLFVNLILLAVLELLFSVYKSDTGLSTIFNAGFLLAIATLFYIPSATLLLLIWVSLILLRPYAWRDWVISQIGFSTPFFFISIYYLYMNELSVFWTKALKFTDSHLLFSFVFNERYYFSLGVIACLLIISVMILQANFYKNFIRTRRYQQALGAFLILASSSFMLNTVVALYHFTIVAIPLSIFLGYYFLASKKKFWREVFFLVLLATLVYNYIVF